MHAIAGVPQSTTHSRTLQVNMISKSVHWCSRWWWHSLWQFLGTPAVVAFTIRQLCARQCLCGVRDLNSGYAIVLRSVSGQVWLCCSSWFCLQLLKWCVMMCGVCHSFSYSSCMMLFLHYHDLSGQRTLNVCSITFTLFSCLYECGVCRSECGVS